MEDQAISMALRSGEMIFLLTRSGAHMAMQLAALVRALANKLRMRGQVSVKALTRQYDTTAFSVPAKDLGNFSAGAKSVNLMYGLAAHAREKYITVVVRTADVGNFNHIVEEYGIGGPENDVRETAVPEGAKDVGIVTEADVGEEYYAFTLPNEAGLELQRAADEKGLTLAAVDEMGAPADYLEKNEVMKDGIAAAVAKNKDASPESRMVHDRHWPALARNDRLESVRIDIHGYGECKSRMAEGNIPYAPVPKGDKMQIVFRAEDRTAVQRIAGGLPEHKAVVSAGELESRQRAAAPKGEMRFIASSGSIKGVQSILADAGDRPPVFTKVMKADKFYEDIHHRMERVRNETRRETVLEQELSAENRNEYLEFGMSGGARDAFRNLAEEENMVVLEQKDETFSRFIILPRQKDQALSLCNRAGADAGRIAMNRVRRETVKDWIKEPAGLKKLDAVRAQLIQAASELKRAAQKTASQGEKELGG